MTHAARATGALLNLAEVDPALSTLALWCSHRDDPGPTRTCGDVILYGPEFDALPVQEAMGLAGHHILHVALRHSARLQDWRNRLGNAFDPTLYALCTDAVVNETLLAADLALPRPAVTLTGLLKAAMKPPASPLSALAEWDADRLYFALLNSPESKGKAQDYGKAQGFVPDFEGEGETQASGTESDDTDWSGRLTRALSQGRAAGQGIGAIGLVLGLTPPSGVSWERELRRFLAKATIADPRISHRRPARSWIAREAQARASGARSPAFEPAQIRRTPANHILIAIDLSSSIDHSALSLFAAEIDAIARRTRAKLTVLGFDTALQSQTTLPLGATRATLESMDWTRGGGTDFAPVMASARDMQPSALVVLTDLDGPPGAAPGCPVLWCTIDPPQDAPPFGRVVSLNQRDAAQAKAEQRS